MIAIDKKEKCAYSVTHRNGKSSSKLHLVEKEKGYRIMKKMFIMAAMMMAGSMAFAFTHDTISSNKSDRGEVTAVVGGFGGDLANSLTFYADAYVTFSFVSEKSNIAGWNSDAMTFTMYGINQDLQGSNSTWLDAGNQSTNGSITFNQLMKYGESVGFAISDGNKIIYSTPGVNASDPNSKVAFHLDPDTGVLYVGFFVNGYSQNSIDKADVVYAISVDSSGPANGQPLPGVLATALIGAGVLVRRRRRS